MPDFEYLGLCPELLRICEENKWFLPTPVQDEAIPLILGGGDVMAAAETGSGKTAAFALPILQVVHEALVSKKMFGKKSNVSDRKHSNDGVDVKAARVENIKLNVDDRDSLLAVDPTGIVCQSRHEKQWSGVRADVGVTGGNVYFEGLCEDDGLCRVGWSTLAGKLNLGTCRFGYGFGGTGMKSNGRKFEKYGHAFSKGDVIGCFLSFEKRQIVFSINGKSCGVAYNLSPKVKGPFFPAVVLKNAQMSFNFGGKRFRFPPHEGYVGLLQNDQSYFVKSSISSNNSGATFGGAQSHKGGDKKGGPMAIVIAPTRDLAEQIHKTFETCSRWFSEPRIFSTLFTGGGMNISNELKKLQNGAQIVVGTPGKIVDFMVKQGKIKTHNVRFFVLDEADQLCGDKEGLETIMKIFNKLPKKSIDGSRLQVSFFSATLHGKEIQSLSSKLCFQPTWVDLKGKDSVPETVHHCAVEVNPYSFLQKNQTPGMEKKYTDKVHARDNLKDLNKNNRNCKLSKEATSEGIKCAKYRALRHLIDTMNMDQCLIFCRTNVDCDNLEKYMIEIGGGRGGFQGKRESGKENPYSCVVVAGFRRQQERRENLQYFKDGDVRFLICTDVAARGIDIKGLPFVINFTLPDKTENYIHRIGRVGRAGKMGLAISLVSQSEEKVWYHANCKNRGKGCTNTRLVSQKGCCIWYNEPSLFADVEKRVGHKIERELPDPSSLDKYGEDEQEESSSKSMHLEKLKPAVQELAIMAKESQDRWLQMSIKFSGIMGRQGKKNSIPSKKKKTGTRHNNKKQKVYH